MRQFMSCWYLSLTTGALVRYSQGCGSTYNSSGIYTGGSAGAFYRLSDCQYYGWCGYLGYCLWQSCNTDRCSRNLYAAQTSVGSATAADTCKHCYRAVCIKICVWYRRHAVVFYADRGTWGSDCLRCIRQSAQSGIKEVPQYTLS